MSKLIEYFKKIIADRFYGKVIISFEGGRIVHLERHISEDAKQFN